MKKDNREVINNEYLSDLSTLAERLKHLREIEEKTLKELAQETYISDKTLQRYETDQSNPCSDYIIRLANHYNVSCDLLLRGINTENLDIHQDTGLSNEAIKWLNSNKNNSEIIKMVNTVLGNELLADVLFNSLYLYATAPLNLNKEIDITNITPRDQFINDKILLRNAVSNYICEVLDSVMYEYQDVVSKELENRVSNKLKNFMVDKTKDNQRVDQLDKSTQILRDNNFSEHMKINT